MRRQLVPAVIAIVLFTALTLVYGIGTTLVDQVLFKHKADGSLVKDAKGQVVGSSLIGQDFTEPKYFHPRPEADGYASGPDYSYGSNYGPTNAALIGNVPGVSSTARPTRTRRRATRTACRCSPPTRTTTRSPTRTATRCTTRTRTAPTSATRTPSPNACWRTGRRTASGPDVPVPVDAVTASGSGLDPDITVANAKLQAPRVATARHLALATVLALVKANTDERAFGVLGEPAVNVLELNLALDRLHAGVRSSASSTSGLRQEADAHARLGEEVAGMGRVGLELVPELRHELAEVVGLVHVARTPHLLEQLALAHEPVGIAHEDLDEMPLRRRQLDLRRRRASVARFVARSMRKSGVSTIGSTSSPGLARRNAARSRARSSPMLNGFVT